MKPVILGARGQVGTTLARELRVRGDSPLISSRTPAAAELLVNFEDPATIASFFRVLESRLQGEAATIFLTGAFTHVDGCELDPKKCRTINRDGPLRVAEECARAGHHLVFFSSEYVFGAAEYEGGAVGPFAEDDPVAPASAYGRAKAEAEAGIQEILGGKATVLRTTVVYSWLPEDKNFAMQLRRFLETKLAGRSPEGVPEKFRIPTDQISTPTYAPALAEATLELARRRLPGIFHVVGADLLARSEFAERLIRLFGLPMEKCREHLEFLPTSALAQPARRPLTAGLRTDKLRELGIRVWTLEESFREYRA